MDSRLLEILQDPDLLILNDIEILEKEISKYPFVQSYRAIQLLATHRFKENDYAAKLSQTAAFTTDKKILYQLIHQKEIEAENEGLVENNVSENGEIATENESISKVEKLIAIPETKFQEVEIKPLDLPKEVYLNGELNRILFEGEEDFLNEESESIDLEATQEAGEIVLAPKDADPSDFTEATRAFTTETIIEEEEIGSEKNIIESSAQLSFHAIDSNLSEENNLVNENQNLDLNESFSQDFTEATRKFTTETIIEEEEIRSESNIIESSSQLSFHAIDSNLAQENNLVNENRNLDLNESFSQDFTEATRKFTTETIIDEDQIKSEEAIIENGSELSFHGSEEFLPDVKIEVKKEATPHFVAENKMSKHQAEMQKLIAEVEAKMKKSSQKIIEKEDDFVDNRSLDFTGISHETPPVTILKTEKTEDNSEEEIAVEEPNSTWKPMSFSAKKSSFRNNEILEAKESNVENEEIAEIKTEEIQENNSDKLISKEEKIVEAEVIEKNEEKTSDKDESNVPVFINTWQSWLKLNPETPVLKENNKQKAIESFIEKEPKISKLKEESSFTVKDKGDNISHLMTETLANLYLDQKLYSKAQKAFELLIEKEPTKAEKFKQKIQAIKDLRNQK